MPALSLASPVPAEDRRRAVALVALALGHVALALGAALLSRAVPLPLAGARHFSQDAWYALGFKGAGMLGLSLLLIRRWGERPWRDRLGGRAALLCAAALLVGATLNLGYLPSLAAGLSARAPQEAAGRALLAVLLAFFTAALPEELYYRALLQTRLEALAGRVGAWLTSALLFAAWHLPSRWLLASGAEGEAGDLASVLFKTGLPVLLVGLGLGALWGWKRRLWPLVFLHLGVDLLPGLASLL